MKDLQKIHKTIMTILLLEAPSSLSSKESQTNDFIVERVVKALTDTELTICLFGTYLLVFYCICRSEEVQRYISSLYLILWDYCLLYKKIQTNCIVLPYVEGGSERYMLVKGRRKCVNRRSNCSGNSSFLF